MKVETDNQKYCITRERNQVPEAGIFDALATIAFIGAIKIVEAVPHLNLKNNEAIKAIKADAKRVLAMAIMAIEVKYLDNGWTVSENHPMVDSLSLEEMKAGASSIHHI